MAYTAIPNADLDQDSPVTQTLMTLLRDNPIAIAAGDTDAPVNETGWHPYDMVTVGDGANGLLYSFPVDGAVAAVDSPQFEAGYEYLFIVNQVKHDQVSSADFEIQIGTAAGPGTWVVGYTQSVGATITISGQFIVPTPRFARAYQHVVSIGLETATTTGNAMQEALRKTGGSVQTYGIRLAWSAGNFDGGQIYMMRRREFMSG